MRGSPSALMLVFRLVADLEIPAVRIANVEALEVLAHHVGTRIEAATLELRLHGARVPRLNAPRNVVDHAGDRRSGCRISSATRVRCRGLRCRGRGRGARLCATGGRRLPLSTRVADDDTADAVDVDEGLRPRVVLYFPPHETGVEVDAALVVGHGVRDVVQPNGLPGCSRMRRRL